MRLAPLFPMTTSRLHRALDHDELVDTDSDPKGIRCDTSFCDAFRDHGWLYFDPAYDTATNTAEDT